MTVVNTLPFVQYTDIKWAGYMAEIDLLFTQEDRRRIGRAYNLSKDAHRKQKRDSGRRYFDHPRELTLITLWELQIYEANLIIKELLHDTDEDSWILDREGMEILFGWDIARSIRILTRDPNEGYVERLIRLGTWQDLVAKLVDRLHNLRTITDCTPEKIARKIKETKDHYLQLIDVLRERIPQQYSHIPDLLLEKIIEAITVAELTEA